MCCVPFSCAKRKYKLEQEYTVKTVSQELVISVSPSRPHLLVPDPPKTPPRACSCRCRRRRAGLRAGVRPRGGSDDLPARLYRGSRLLPTDADPSHVGFRFFLARLRLRGRYVLHTFTLRRVMTKGKCCCYCCLRMMSIVVRIVVAG